MNNRKRTLRKAMLSTYVEGKVLRKESLFTNLVPMKRCYILYHINLCLTNYESAPFYYNSGRKQYIFEMDACNKSNRITLEQISWYAHKTAGTPATGETPLQRRLRLIRENSLYGVDGVTEQELLDKRS